MSMQTWENQGYGIVSDGYDAVDIIKKLVELAESGEILADVEELKSCLIEEDGSEADTSDVEDYLNEITDYQPLKNITEYLNKKYDCVGFTSPSISDDGYIALLYEPLYPWQGSDGDRKLTKEQIDGIFKETAEMLGWNCEPDFQTLYYCG